MTQPFGGKRAIRRKDPVIRRKPSWVDGSLAGHHALHLRAAAIRDRPPSSAVIRRLGCLLSCQRPHGRRDSKQAESKLTSRAQLTLGRGVRGQCTVGGMPRRKRKALEPRPTAKPQTSDQAPGEEVVQVNDRYSGGGPAPESEPSEHAQHQTGG
jgi:hypothetical protein